MCTGRGRSRPPGWGQGNSAQQPQCWPPSMGFRDVCGFELIFQLSDPIDSATVGGVWSRDIVPCQHFLGPSWHGPQPLPPCPLSRSPQPAQACPWHLAVPMACARVLEQPVEAWSLSPPLASLWDGSIGVPGRGRAPCIPKISWRSHFVQTWGLPLIYCVTLDRLLDLSQPQLPRLKSRQLLKLNSRQWLHRLYPKPFPSPTAPLLCDPGCLSDLLSSILPLTHCLPT